MLNISSELRKRGTVLTIFATLLLSLSAKAETKLSGSCENQTGFFSFSIGLSGGESRLAADKFIKLPKGQRKVLELSGQVVGTAPSDQVTVFKLSQDSSIQYLTGSQNRLPLQSITISLKNGLGSDRLIDDSTVKDAPADILIDGLGAPLENDSKCTVTKYTF